MTQIRRGHLTEPYSGLPGLLIEGLGFKSPFRESENISFGDKGQIPMVGMRSVRQVGVHEHELTAKGNRPDGKGPSSSI